MNSRTNGQHAHSCEYRACYTRASSSRFSRPPATELASQNAPNVSRVQEGKGGESRTSGFTPCSCTSSHVQLDSRCLVHIEPLAEPLDGIGGSRSAERFQSRSQCRRELTCAVSARVLVGHRGGDLVRRNRLAHRIESPNASHVGGSERCGLSVVPGRHDGRTLRAWQVLKAKHVANLRQKQ